MLTPEMIRQANQVTGQSVPLNAGSGAPVVPSRADEIIQIGKQAQQAKAKTEFDSHSHLGEGGAGEFSGNAVRAVASPLIRTGSLIEKGLDETAGRVINAAKGKGFTPTNTGEQAQKTATDLDEGASDSLAGQLGTITGVLAPYFTGAGEAASAEKVASMVPKLAEHFGVSVESLMPKIISFLGKEAPTVARDTAIGTAQTGDPVQGLEQGVGSATIKAVGAGVKAARAVTPEKTLEQAIKDATPSYSKTLIGEPHVDIKAPDGTVTKVPRVQEGGGLTKGRTVTSSQSEIAAGEELSKVPDYAKAKTSLEKYNAVEPEITRQAKALETSLKGEGVLRPPKEVAKLIRNTINTAAQDSLLLQKTDPVVKNYMRVVNRAIDQNDGTLYGELKVRQALDDAYELAGGKYNNEKGLDQIHRAARNAINDDLEAHATETEVKAALRRMSHLYRAADVLQDKARAEGGSMLEQAMKAHPVATKLITGATKAAGLGAGLHLLP